MMRFRHTRQPWGSFVDVKVNAPEVLARQLASGRLRPGTVMISSVCDGWQPLEATYRLTRQCLDPLWEKGFELHVLTKAELVRRDFDLLCGRERVSVGVTLTTMDEQLRSALEPASSPSTGRVEVLEEAARRQTRVYAFLGPLIPGLTDTAENVAGLFEAIAHLPLEHVYVDRLHLRWGVRSSLRAWVEQHRPHLARWLRSGLLDRAAEARYERNLRGWVERAAAEAGLANQVRVIF
jgi:DNA repair photolyase